MVRLGEHVEHEGHVGDGASHGPGVGQTSVGAHRPVRDPSPRGLDAGHPGERGGDADGAAAVGPQRQGNHAGGQCCRAPTARAPRGARWVPRVAGDSGGRGVGDALPPELGCRRLAQQNRSVAAQGADARRIVGPGAGRVDDRRSLQRRPALGQEDVLDADRNTVEATPRGAGGPPVPGGRGVAERAFRVEMAPGPESRVEAVDARQEVLGDLQRGQRPVGVCPDEVDGGHPLHVAGLWSGHRPAPLMARLSTTWSRGSPARHRSRLASNWAPRAANQPTVSPDMWGDTTTWSMSQNGWSPGRGSVSNTSRAAPATPTAAQGGQQGGLVDDRPPAHVDQVGARSHGGEDRGVDQVVRGGREGGGDDHVVGSGQVVVEVVDGADGQEVGIGVPGGPGHTTHLHPDGAEQPGDGAADAACADHEHPATGQALALAVPPGVGALEVEAGSEVLGEQGEHREDPLCDVVVEHPVGVGDDGVGVDHLGREHSVHSCAGGVDPGQLGGPGAERGHQWRAEVVDGQRVGAGQRPVELRAGAGDADLAESSDAVEARWVVGRRGRRPRRSRGGGGSPRSP